MAANGFRTVPLGEDWFFEEPCVDENGAPLDLTGASATMRIATANALVAQAEATFTAPQTGVALFHIAESAQSGIVPSFYRIEVRIRLPDGTYSIVFSGTLQVTTSLFAQFP